MNAQASPFLTIKLNYIQMNPAMKRIADVLLTQAPELSKYTIDQLAKESRVSNATVTRFVQMLGYPSYKVFSHTVQTCLQDGANGPDRGTPPHAPLYAGGFPNMHDAKSVCQYVIHSEIEMLNDTLSLMDFHLMELVAEQLVHARQVIFLGEGRSYVAAQSACTRFPWLGILCSSHGDFHSMAPAVCMAQQDDLVVGISNMGRSTPVVDCIQQAKSQGLSTVAITSVKGSPLDRAADITLLTGFNYGNFANQDQITCYEPGAENLPQYALIDCLYLMCVTKQSPECLNRYYKTTTIVAQQQL